MSSIPKRLHWLSNGLFWRTFFLLSFLITVSLVIWATSVSVLERAPRARQIGAQIVSIVTVTRVAIANSAPELRRELLIDLKSNEGIKILPLESTDQIEEAPGTEMVSQIESNIRARLGENTKFAGVVNGHEGFWISSRSRATRTG